MVNRKKFVLLQPNFNTHRQCSKEFDEFLGAMGETSLCQMVRNADVPEPLHERVMNLFNRFSLVGGMPQAVSRYSSSNDIIALDSVYQSLLTGYLDDTEKYAQSETMRNVIRHIITNGWTNDDEQITFDRFAASNYKSREVGEAMRTIQKTLLLELVYPSVETSLPLVPDMKKRPRLMWLDIGLVNYAAGVQSELYQVDDLNDAWRGKIAEHIVGQELIGNNYNYLGKRSFWVRDSKNAQAELDYLFNSRKFGLIPIEVKSGTNAHLKSLQEFMFDSPCSFAIRFWNKPAQYDSIHIKRKDKNGETIKSKDYTLYSLPYYYAGNIEKSLLRLSEQISL